MKNPRPFLALLVLALLRFAPPLSAAVRPVGPRLLAELSAGPLIGLDRALKGGSGGFLLGLVFQPFEAGLRAGAAYDSALGTGLLRFDLELGLGSGVRAIVGGLFPLGELALPDPSGSNLRGQAMEAGPWPDRFGLSSTLLSLPRKLLGAEGFLDAELVYTEYRLPWPAESSAGVGQPSLSGAAAFAAGIEGGLYLRLRWSP